jgi:hypothetical protein
MRGSTSAEPRRRRCLQPLLAVLVLLGGPAVAAEGFTILRASAEISGERIVVSGSMDLELSEAAETALAKGIPLDILIEFRLQRHRRFWLDAKLGEWTLRAQIKYHALSGLYLVALQGSRQAETFSSQRAALDYIGTLSRVSFPLPPGAEPPGDEYLLRLRARMDLDSLPAALRPMAYTRSAWRLKSKWTDVALAP